MKSKASYFSISVPMLVENLRRFYAIPALAFLFYFLSGVFPILMTYTHINDMADYIQLSLNNQQPFYLCAHLVFPIITSIVIFRYLQGVSSVSVMHSMPFTRAKLFNSGFLSGLILIFSPIVLNGLILLAISKPAYSQYGTSEGIMTNTTNVFSRPEIISWILVSLLVVFVVYIVSIFAGMLTGNVLMHFATAVWFNFLIPGLYAVFIAYFSYYLYGFDTSSNWMDFCLAISPYLNAIAKAGTFTGLQILYYLLSALILLALSAFLYQKRKLEKATDSLVFGFTEPIICYLVTFLGMTLLGFYFDVLGESPLYMYAGYAAGAIIFFIVGQMVVKKTPQIFNLKSLKSFIIYSIVATLIIGGIFLDLTGFEKRVPSSAEINSFRMSENFINQNGYYSSKFYYNHSRYDSSLGASFRGDAQGLLLESPENIKSITAFHKSILDNRKNLEKLEDSSTYFTSFRIAYNPFSSFPASRQYNIDYKFFSASKDLKQIFESDEYKSYYAPTNIKYEKLLNIDISNDLPYGESVNLTSQTQMNEFLACLDQDFRAQSFEDMTSLKRDYCRVMINFDYKDITSNEPERVMNETVEYIVTNNYTKTLKWLDENGYKDQLTLDLNDIKYAEVFHYVVQKDESGNNITMEVKEQSQIKKLTVTDQLKLRDLIERSEKRNLNYDDYYYVVFYFDSANSEVNNYVEDPAHYEKYAEEDSSSTTFEYYFNEGNVPDYVLEYFK